MPLPSPQALYLCILPSTGFSPAAGCFRACAHHWRAAAAPPSGRGRERQLCGAAATSSGASSPRPSPASSAGGLPISAQLFTYSRKVSCNGKARQLVAGRCSCQFSYWQAGFSGVIRRMDISPASDQNTFRLKLTSSANYLIFAISGKQHRGRGAELDLSKILTNQKFAARSATVFLHSFPDINLTRSVKVWRWSVGFFYCIDFCDVTSCRFWSKSAKCSKIR